MSGFVNVSFVWVCACACFKCLLSWEFVVVQEESRPPKKTQTFLCFWLQGKLFKKKILL